MMHVFAYDLFFFVRWPRRVMQRIEIQLLFVIIAPVFSWFIHVYLLLFFCWIDVLWLGPEANIFQSAIGDNVK